MASRFAGLKALYVNGTLTPSPGASHTDTLIEASAGILRQQGVQVEVVRLVDHHVAPGVQPDMTEHGADRDDWPQIWAKVQEADILVIASPIWLGDMSSQTRLAVERLYAHSGETNERGQAVFYGKVGGALVGGNEDGQKLVSSKLVYAMQHLGVAIPPNAEAGWVGEAGPGPSYGDELDDGTRAGFDNDFTKKNITFMAWNLMHLAAMLRDAGGFPAEGNLPEEWEQGSRWGFQNPEYR
ncbi:MULTISPECIES: flavodoxin family protein [unclassified Agrococcus]|uniref:flavodoxin family protein n=1 Tax=unclassified Agrococcus TaxID=2615065 RepID=UPI003622E7D5